MLPLQYLAANGADEGPHVVRRERCAPGKEIDGRPERFEIGRHGSKFRLVVHVVRPGSCEVSVNTGSDKATNIIDKALETGLSIHDPSTSPLLRQGENSSFGSMAIRQQ